MPFNYFWLGLIALMFPNSHIIHCRRDPRDTCLSCFFTYFSDRNEHSYDLSEIGTWYRQYARLMDHWKATLPLTILDLPYEDMVQDQQQRTRDLIAFCGLPWDPQCLQFHTNVRPVRTASNLQVRQPIYSSSIGRWKKYQSHLGPLIEALGNTE